MTTETIGYTGPVRERCEYLALSFSPLSAPLRSRWRNNGVSADFLGDYVKTFLPTDDEADVANSQNEIRHAVTYIANEFLENAMKYHERDVDVPIGIRLELTSNEITVSASNAVDAEQAIRYKTFVENVVKSDARELLLEQLEQSSASAAGVSSCLGLLTMISDYSVQMGWRFECQAESSVMTVTTSAVLPLRSLEGASA